MVSGAPSRCLSSGSSPSRRCQAASLDVAAKALILVALAAVGMSIHLGELRETSWRPLAVGFAVALVVGAGSLTAILGLGLGSAIGT